MSDQREFLAQWSQSQGNLRRFLEERVMPPLDDDAQRTAGRAAAAAAVEETFGINIDDFALGVDSVGGAFETAGRQKITPPDPEVPQDTEAAAFFDVDNTLIQGSSLILLAQGLFKKRFITLSELAPALRKQIRYRVSGSENADDIAEGREQALAIVKGKSVEELKQACREIVDNRMLQKSYADTIELASMHLAAGQQVWLVSATPVQIGQALAETLGFTGALGTVAEEEDGKFTGRLVGDILHGPGKKHAVAALAALQQLDLSKCTAYSDSVNDLPMLNMVGSPVAVNPDRALRKHAKAQGWAVRDYRSVRRVMRAGVVPAVLAAAGLWWWRRRR
ncbi:phosphoserine phosphatase [Corynebacterium afermentans subsp. afermentans]|uniref:Phosphoserine phosphatase n=2 Tax=Corynebacterium TaxID=1716 RepID=A0A9X8WHL1_9CORY|nr:MULTISPECIES: HAD-IB family hydrolase [Corynebacterium]MCG7292856.1 HAD-IB family hydrolase [Corynebacterium afermentans]OAA16848.1 phosphoserine phosphatase [Corynebacterium afermentans subsp. afermentans]WCZ33723.1 phosphoserine phosphatase [Corynebacterium ihumii]WJY55873.1 phosphoserine phosphatase [Corynebacterium afermentans subsp. afermentans]SIQ19467.1 phosphoserine phosphatase [Corynebacterium afermentans]